MIISNHNTNIVKETIKNRTFTIEVLNKGREGFIATEKTKDEEHRYILPPILGRVQSSGEVHYILPEQAGDEVLVVTGKEVENQEAFLKRGVALESEAMQDKTLRNLWRRLTEYYTAIQVSSPTIYDGVPFLTSKHVGEDLGGTQEQAMKTLDQIAPRLQPLGRWVTGLLLVSPWIQKIGSINTVIHTVGEGGSGKTALAQLGSWLYSPAEIDSKGLLTSFNSSGQGLQTLSQNLSYYPLILDETNSTTGDIGKTLTDLVMGSSRQRANRNGSAQGTRGQWCGVVFTTGNTKLGLRHELWDRRLLTLQASKLWNIPEEGKRTWWGEFAELINKDYGYTWQKLTETYTPGQESAKDLTRDFNQYIDKHHQNVDLDEDDRWKVALLGLFGCSLIEKFTQNPKWTEGVLDEIEQLLNYNTTLKTDLKKDFSEIILKDRAEYPEAWNENLRDSYYNKIIKAWPAIISNRGGHNVITDCGIDHEGPCTWINVRKHVIEDLTWNIDLERLFMDETFHKAMFMGTNNGKKYRRVKSEGQQISVYTLCLSALEEFESGESTLVEPKNNDEEVEEDPLLNDLDDDFDL